MNHLIQNNEVARARDEVEINRARVESALDSLETQFNHGINRVQDTVYQAQAPIRWVSRNPLPSLAILLTGGTFLGYWWTSRLDRKRVRVVHVRHQRFRPTPGWD